MRLLLIFMVRYILRLVYSSDIKALFFLWGKMLAIPYAAKVYFCFFDTKWEQHARLAIFGYLLYNTYGMNNNSECLFVGTSRRHYKEFTRAFEK